MATPDDYLWAEAPDDELMGLTLSWASFTGDIGDLIRAGGHSFTRLSDSMTTRAMFGQPEFVATQELVLIDRLGSWVLLISPNGYEYSLPGVVAGASRLGRVVSVFWNVEAAMRVLVADSGLISRSFDPLLYEPAGAMREESGLRFGDPDAPLRAPSLAFAERITDQRLMREQLFEPHEGVVLDRREWRSDDPNCETVSPFDV